MYRKSPQENNKLYRTVLYSFIVNIAAEEPDSEW